ncbi:MAG: hypothetical protein JNM41_06710 [Flavipsychrobacter sp.]|nr:hypothetical protein [Flavipsychrobacter sp.]
MRKSILLASFSIMIVAMSFQASAQVQLDNKESTALAEKDESDELANMLNESDPATKKKTEYTIATFKTTRIINSHSIENTGKGVLDLKISHRFTSIDKGIKDFFGLDGATIRLGLDYGLTDGITVGIGRNSYEKEYDGYVKAKILRQSNRSPLSVSYVGSSMIQTLDANVLPGQTYYFSNRVCYANQILVARKFSQSLSLQFMPTHVHYNLVELQSDANDLIALGFGGRLKLSKRVSLNLEYFYQLPDLKMAGTTNSLSVGFDIETGGHVFQLHFTNSAGLTERTYVGRTTDKWTDGGIRFGFNISRVFTVRKPREFKNLTNKIY